MLESMKLMVLLECNDRDNAGHHVEQERPEVTGQRDNEQALRDVGRGIMRENTKAVPDVVRKTLDRVIAHRCAATEVEHYPEDANNRRNDGERPNRHVWSKILAVELSQVTGKLVVAAHRVSDTRSGIHAGKSSPDKREKHGDGLDKHEPPTGLRTSEDPRPNNLHHVADWRR
jgi:hypothetical protein